VGEEVQLRLLINLEAYEARKFDIILLVPLVWFGIERTSAPPIDGERPDKGGQVLVPQVGFVIFVFDTDRGALHLALSRQTRYLH
jgi:hypothetical protein